MIKDAKNVQIKSILTEKFLTWQQCYALHWCDAADDDQSQKYRKFPRSSKIDLLMYYHNLCDDSSVDPAELR